MRSTIIGLGLATACLLGPAAAAEASTGHHVGQVQPSCGCGSHHGHPGKHHGKKHGHPRPKPRPKPVHHRHPKPCPPPAHHHKHHPRPVIHPRPPVVSPPAHVVTVAHVTPTTLPTQLAFTGMSEGLVLTGLGGAALVFIGVGVIRLAGGFKQSGPKHREF